MAIGYMILQARTAHDALPIGGVQIKILDPFGTAVYQLVTDENGETGRVPLETVERSFSLNPYYTGQTFTGYNVLAQAAGFDSVYVSQIPVYEGETAILPLTMLPVPAGGRAPSLSEIFVGAPAVTMQEERSPKEGKGSPYVLRQVVIPNPITVHLGAPGSSAKNVQVSFPDYVKNVASSEIYPTWPDASLRANIYAIITFALNRIYTEWYRSRGYNYDITNSTAYDQYFVYGRAIYESISRIVDDIFNEYVKKPGQSAPFFTSFCNGTTVTCKGLSQWGTVALAENGLSPLAILRSYYPKDVQIAEASAISGVVTSYPGTALRQGSRGQDVEAVQVYLKRIRKNYPAIPAITDPAGEFGKSTRAAVVQFQKIFNLAADGIVGKSTWYKISSIYTAVARLAELNSEGNTLGIGSVPPGSTLRQGSRGQDVITLQYLLDVASEYYPGIPAVAQDGIFGSGTKDAVVAFQRQMRLNPDGIVGALTWQALYQVYQGIGENVPMPDPSPGTLQYTVVAGDTLWSIARRYGTTVEAIKALNGLSGDLLQIGQALKIPSGQGVGIPYTVVAGDTLWAIARRFQTTVEELKRLNGLAGDEIQVGQTLWIPG